MSTTTYYSKRIIGVFFSAVFLCAGLLFVVQFLDVNGPNIQKDFVEVVGALAGEIEQTASLPIINTNLTKEETIQFQYIEVTESCGAHFNGDECLNVRKGPGVSFPTVTQLRNGIVLKVEDLIVNDEGEWYKIVFDEWLRYPNRVSDNWYISANFVRPFFNSGAKDILLNDEIPSTAKQIVIVRSKQTLTAYEGEEIFMETSISTGLDLSPTPRGTFTIFRRTPTRYMQGPIPNIPGSDYYDLPGVPWNLYFTNEGAVIHGAYWHNSFGTKYSHGCVNLNPTTAETLYHWADLGTKVIVKD
ncbi:MAG: L,D-transpeptidase family protein [Candidatus Paceibacteria bacterium]